MLIFYSFVVFSIFIDIINKYIISKIYKDIISKSLFNKDEIWLGLQTKNVSVEQKQTKFGVYSLKVWQNCKCKCVWS